MLASDKNEPILGTCWGCLPKSKNIQLNEIQALAVIGVSRLSSILRDNKKSCLNKAIVDMFHVGMFDSISILAVDNVALYGYDLLSVICTRCGQASEMSLCGQALSKLRLVYFHISMLLFALLVSVYVLHMLWIFAAVVVAMHNREDNPHQWLLYTIFCKLSEKLCQ